MPEKIQKEGEIGMEPEIHDMCQTYQFSKGNPLFPRFYRSK
mgnify:CR=1 FL=1